MKRSRAVAATLCAGAALAAVLALGNVGAQRPGDAEIRKAFAAADVNADASLDVNEFVANTIYLFRQLDKDHDRYLSLQEWSAGDRGDRHGGFKAADRNGDGKISVGEAVAAKMIEFFDIDSNHDGAITIDELLAYEHSIPVAKAGR
jgi:Ca2+-binding EF-hand superfamily protein